eukprot:SAG22_NODE_897_length_6629_cov_4.853446_7_plen_58_part_00
MLDTVDSAVLEFKAAADVEILRFTSYLDHVNVDCVRDSASAEGLIPFVIHEKSQVKA